MAVAQPEGQQPPGATGKGTPTARSPTPPRFAGSRGVRLVRGCHLPLTSWVGAGAHRSALRPRGQARDDCQVNSSRHCAYGQRCAVPVPSAFGHHPPCPTLVWSIWTLPRSTASYLYGCEPPGYAPGPRRGAGAPPAAFAAATLDPGRLCASRKDLRLEAPVPKPPRQ